MVNYDKNYKNKINELYDNMSNENFFFDEEFIKLISKKRGRKSNKELEILKKYYNYKKDVSDNNSTDNKIPKKRGRKPKGGKLIKKIKYDSHDENITKTNIILHLKCSSNEINVEENSITGMSYNPNIENIKPYNEFNVNTFNNEYLIKVDNNKVDNNDDKNFNENINFDNNNIEKINTDISMKIIWSKLKDLQNSFTNKLICDKKSSCFWCTCDFEWSPIHIPKCMINNKVEVYGCFCMPECAVGYLFNENIDTSTMWERYALINNIYSKIYNYTNNIKPAPNPRYFLNKFFGNFTIEEYRNLIRKEKQILIIDKPLTHILPELVEDNIDNNCINDNKKYKLYRNKPSYNKLKTNNKSWAFKN